MSDDGRLDRPAEWTGRWWLPDDLDNPVPGVLRYELDEGLRLSLIGGFEDRILRPTQGGVAVMEGSRNWPLVLGVAGNREIALLDCVPVSSKSYGMGMDGPNEQTMSALTALVGCTWKTPNKRYSLSAGYQ